MEEGFSDVRASIFQIINRPEIPGQKDVIATLHNFEVGIRNRSELPSPFEAMTDAFMEDVMPTAIQMILRTKVNDEKCRNILQQILQTGLRLLPQAISSKWDAFVDAATDILVREKHPFYVGIFPSRWSIEKKYPHHVENVELVMKSDIQARIISYVQTNQNISFRRYSSIFRLISQFREKKMFPTREIDQCIKDTVESLQMRVISLEGEKIRTVDEKYVDRAFTLLSNFRDWSRENQGWLFQIRMRIYVMMIKSPYLQKRFAALGSIKELLVDRKLEVCKLLSDNNIIDCLLDGLHQEIIPNFMFILKEMTVNGFAEEKQIAKVWHVSLQGHRVTSEAFFNAWDLFIEKLPDTYVHWIFRAVACSTVFPRQALEFIIKFHTRIKDNRIREDIYISLQAFYMKSDFPPSDKNMLISAICCSVPTTAEYQEIVYNAAEDMINNNANIELGLGLLMLSEKTKDMNPEKAKKFFDVVLSLKDGGLAPYLDFIAKIIRWMGNITEADFDKLLDKTFRYFETDSEKISSFYMNQISGQKLTIAMMKNILMRLSKIPMKPGILQLVERCVRAVKSKHEEFTMNILWDFLQNQPDKALVDFMVSLYNKPSDITMIMAHAESDLRNKGILSVLLALIHQIEDEIDKDKLKIRRNKFLDGPMLMHIELSGDINVTMLVPRSMTMNKFRGYLGHKMEKPKTGIRFETRETELHDRMKLVVSSIATNDKYMPIQKQALPTEILKGSTNVLVDLLEEEEIGDIVLEIINEMPIDEEQIRILKQDHNWDDFLLIDKHRTLMYRLNMVGNIARIESKFVVETGGFTVLLQLAFKEIDKRSDTELLLLQAIISMICDMNKEVCAMLKEIDAETLNTFMELIRKKSVSVATAMLYLLREVVKSNETILTETEQFTHLMKFAILKTHDSVRNAICDIIRAADIASYENSFLPVLQSACRSNKTEVLSVLDSLLDGSQHVLWNACVDLVLKKFAPGNDKTTVQKLTFVAPPYGFTMELFNLLIKYLDTLEKPIARVKELGLYLLDNCLFNEVRYFATSHVLIKLISKLMALDAAVKDRFVAKSEEYYRAYKKIEPQNSVGDPDLRSDCMFKGLKNLGATCYMNAVLQQFFYLTPLRNAIISEQGEHEKWFEELQNLFARMCTSPTGYVSTEAFVSNWKSWDDKPVNPREQQDAVEFVQLLIDRLETVIPDQIKQLFQGTLEYRVEGVGSDFVRETNEPFVNIPLEVKDHADMKQAMRTFLIPDEFDEYRDGEGSEAIRTTRRGAISALPDVLIITLKRFAYDMTNGRREKINTRFSYPEQLDVSSITTRKDEKSTYRLSGVILHSGNANAGHYISHIKPEKHWLTFNDMSVTSSNTNIIPTTFGDGTQGPNAYILFYVRDDMKMRSDSEITVPDKFIDPLLQDIRLSVIRNLNRNKEYMSLFIENVQNPDIAFEFILSGNCAEMLEKRCEDVEFAGQVIRNEERHDNMFFYQQDAGIQSKYLSILATSIKHCTAAEAENFLEFAFYRVLDHSEVFPFCEEFRPNLMQPLLYYLETDNRVEVEEWTETIGAILWQLKLNQHATTFNLGIMGSILNCLAKRDERFIEKIADIIPREIQTSVLAGEQYDSTLSTMLLARDPEQIAKVCASPSVTPESFTSMLSILLSDHSPKTAECMSILTTKNPMFQVTTIEEMQKQSGELAPNFNHVMKTFIKKFLLGRYHAVRVKTCQFMYSLLPNFPADCEEKAEKTSTAYVLFHSMYRALADDLIDVTNRTAATCRGLAQGNKFVPEAVYEHTPILEYFRILKWSIKCSDSANFVADRSKIFNDSLTQLIDLARNVSPRPLLALLDFLADTLNPHYMGMFIGDSMKRFATIFDVVEFDRQESSTRNILARLLAQIPETLAECFFESTITRRIKKFYACRDELSKQFTTTVYTFYKKCTGMKDMSRSTREKFASQILDSLYSSNKILNEGLELTWKLAEIDGIITDIMSKHDLHWQIWDYCAKELDACMKLGKITEQNNALMCGLETLEVFNRVYHSINIGQTRHIFSWTDKVEALANDWEKRLSVEKLMRAAALPTTVTLSHSGIWMFLTSLAKLSYNLNKKVINSMGKLKPLIASTSPMCRRGCVASIHEILRISLKRKIIQHEQACDFILNEFVGYSGVESYNQHVLNAIFLVIREMQIKPSYVDPKVIDALKRIISQIKTAEVLIEDIFIFAWETKKIDKSVAHKWITDVEKLIARKLEEIAASQNNKSKLIKDFMKAVNCMHKISSYFKLEIPKSTANQNAAELTLEIIQSNIIEITSEDQTRALMYLTSCN